MLKDDLEQEINQFFREIHNMLPEGKKKALLLLFDKYMHLSTTPMKLDKGDFDAIKESGIQLFKDQGFPKAFNNSHREISTYEAANFCLIEATISHLYSKDCLKKMPKFDLKQTEKK